MTRLWQLSSRGKAAGSDEHAAGSDRRVTGSVAEPPAEPPAERPAQSAQSAQSGRSGQSAPSDLSDTADPSSEPQTAVGSIAVTVVPGFDSPRPNVWIRNEGTSEVTGLAVTHEPRSGEPVSVPAPTQRLLPGEACVVALTEHADGEVRVSGTAHDADGRSVELEEDAGIPAEQVSEATSEGEPSPG